MTQKEGRAGGKPNRLANETSTYLLQHAHNPVDWFPWGEEAIAKAKAEDKPILLSVGYSACHWCHVMEHESFEDEETAALMNKLFVNIKVDREERPDIDEIYMKAVQMLTGHGGWPMTVFLTPQLKPFFGGTYFPKEDRHGLPSFKKLLVSVHTAWVEQRDNVEESSTDITEHLALLDQVRGERSKLSQSIIDHAVDRLLQVFDYQWGGFGGAPKFPHTSTLELAMRQVKQLPAPKASRRDECLNVVTTTLNKMAYGGMHDQIGGGFARYSVDRQWLVPHFEKMLYDNALLCRNYLDGYLLTGRTYWLKVAQGILEFVSRELTTEDGAFYSSLDADSEGEEGKFYVWTPAEVRSVLGKEDGDWMCGVLGCTDGGNFEHGTSVLHLTDSPEALSKRLNMSEEDFWTRFDELSQKLLSEREKRVRPGRDEKVLTSWTSLMISAYAAGYRVLKDERYLAAAKRAADFILTRLMKEGRLLRTYGRGHAKLDGYLDDYSYFVQALLDLSSCDYESRWYDSAVKLTDYAIKHFVDAENGGFFYTSDEHEQLITRTKNFFDGSVPSATSVMVMNLLRLGRLTGNDEYSHLAEQVLEVYTPYLSRIPDQFSNMLCALDFSLSSAVEIALVADTKKADWKDMVFAIHGSFRPNSVVLVKSDSESNGLLSQSPLMQDRPAQDGKPTVYICRNYACQAPLTDAEAVSNRVKELV